MYRVSAVAYGRRGQRLTVKHGALSFESRDSAAQHAAARHERIVEFMRERYPLTHTVRVVVNRSVGGA